MQPALSEPRPSSQPLGSGVKGTGQSHVADHSGRFDPCDHPAFPVECARPSTGEREDASGADLTAAQVRADLHGRAGKKRKVGSGLALSWLNVLCSRKYRRTINSDPSQRGSFLLVLEEPLRERETSVCLSCPSAGPAVGRRARLDHRSATTTCFGNHVWWEDGRGRLRTRSWLCLPPDGRVEFLGYSSAQCLAEDTGYVVLCSRVRVAPGDPHVLRLPLSPTLLASLTWAHLTWSFFTGMSLLGTVSVRSLKRGCPGQGT